MNTVAWPEQSFALYHLDSGACDAHTVFAISGLLGAVH